MKLSKLAAACLASFTLVAAPAFSADADKAGTRMESSAKADRTVRVNKSSKDADVKKGETILFIVEAMPPASGASVGAGAPPGSPHSVAWKFDGSASNVDFNDIDPTVPPGVLMIHVIE